MSWQTSPLSELLDVLESGSRPKGGVRGIESGVPSVGGEHLNSRGGFDFTSVKYVPHGFAEKMRRGRIKHGDVLVVKDGATTGKTSFAGENFPYQNAFVNEHVFICRPNQKVEPKYLFWYLFSDEGQRRILENFKGSAQGGINQEFSPNTEIPVAPIEQQRRIVAKLDQVTARIDDTKARLDTIPSTLKRFRQSILAAAFTGRLTGNWRSDNPIEDATVLLRQIIDARLATSERETDKRKIREFSDSFVPMQGEEAGLPPTWTLTHVGMIGNVCNGSTPSRKDDSYWGGKIHWVSSGEVRSGIIASTRESITQAGYENSSVRLLPRGTVLVAMIGEGKTRGQTAILDIEACINQNVAAVVIEHGMIEPKYLWLWFLSQYEITRQAGSGSGPQALNCQRVRELSFVLAPLVEQREIVRRVEALFKQADAIEARYKKARVFVEKLTPSVLAKAFRGELI